MNRIILALVHGFLTLSVPMILSYNQASADGPLPDRSAELLKTKIEQLRSSSLSLDDKVDFQFHRLLIAVDKFCVYCKILKKNLNESGHPDYILIPNKTTGGSDRLYVQFIDPDLNREEFKLYTRAFDLNLNGTPAFFLLVDTKFNGRIATPPMYLGDNLNFISNSISEIISQQLYVPLVVSHDVRPNILSQLLKMRGPQPSQILIAGAYNEPNTYTSPLFSAVMIKYIKSALEKSALVRPEQIVTLYGTGPDSLLEDTHVTNGKKSTFVKYNEFKSDAQFDVISLYTTIVSSQERKIKNNLLVLVGHGSPGGVFSLAHNNVKYSDLFSKWQTNIIVSGLCYGGALAPKSSCGFYAANPDDTAYGCWTQEPSENKDFVSNFFAPFKENRVTSKTKFEDLFWQANLKSPYDSPYSKLDYLADLNRQLILRLIPSLSGRNIKDIVSEVATSAEKTYFDSMKLNKYIDSDLNAKGLDLKAPGLSKTQHKARQFALRILFKYFVSVKPEYFSEDMRTQFNSVLKCEQKSVLGYLNGLSD